MSYADEIAAQVCNSDGLIYRGKSYEIARRADNEIGRLRAENARLEAESKRMSILDEAISMVRVRCRELLADGFSVADATDRLKWMEERLRTAQLAVVDSADKGGK